MPLGVKNVLQECLKCLPLGRKYSDLPLTLFRLCWVFAQRSSVFNRSSFPSHFRSLQNKCLFLCLPYRKGIPSNWSNTSTVNGWLESWTVRLGNFQSISSKLSHHCLHDITDCLDICRFVIYAMALAQLLAPMIPTAWEEIGSTLLPGTVVPYSR